MTGPELSPDKKKLFFFKIITLCISLLPALLLGESVARFYYFGWDSFSVRKMNSLAPVGVSGLIQAADDVEVNRELRPNLDTLFRMKRLLTNSHGLRDKEYDLEKPPQTYRVAVIGDSYTMPTGTEIEEAYHSLLEERLNRESGGRKFEFINFGFAGYYLSNYLGVLRSKAFRYDPDLIIIGFCARNDFDLPPLKALQPYKVKNRSHPFFSESFLLYMVKNSKLAQAAHNMFTKDSPAAPAGLVDRESGREDALSRDSVGYADRIFAEIASLAGRKKIPVVIVYMTLFDTGEKKELAQQLAKKHGFHFIDTTPHFKEKNIREYLFIPEYDSHPNAKAHKIFSEVIYSYLMTEELIK